MTPGALDYLADTFEPRAPGLSAVLRNWAQVVGHDPLAVAKESLEALAGARRLALHAPDDACHLEAIELLEVVMLTTTRAVFAHDARSPMVSLHTRLADVARSAAHRSSPRMTLVALETVTSRLEADTSEEAHQIRGLVDVVRAFNLALSAPQIHALCAGIVALLGAAELRARVVALEVELDALEEEPAALLEAAKELAHAGGQ